MKNKVIPFFLLTVMATLCCSFQLEARQHTSVNVNVVAPVVASRQVVRQYQQNSREVHHYRYDCRGCGNHVREEVIVYEQPRVVREVIIQRPIVRPFFSFSWLWR